MRYLVGYAVYAIGVTAFLVHLLPPQPLLVEPSGRPTYHGATEATLAVVDDYFSQPCTVRVAAFAADQVMFNSREEFERARELLGC